MRVIATLEVDLDTTPLGLKSRLDRHICGVPVLRRTVERVQATKAIDETYVICPQSQVARCSAILEGTGAKMCQLVGEPPAWAKLVTVGRKWSLDGWRGGIGGTTHFDEYIHCALISQLASSVQADIVLALSPAAPLFDPELADRMIEHKIDLGEETRVVFALTPPGLSGIVISADLIAELAEKNIPIGWLFSYKPDAPTRDLSLEDCCLGTPASVRYAVGRMAVDTERSFTRVEQLLREQPDPTLEEVGTWLHRQPLHTADRLPREVELELTTETPYPAAMLRPRGDRVPSRGPLDLDLAASVAADVSLMDDGMLILGGFGDPLRHPHFARMLRAIREGAQAGGGLFGLAVATTGVDLDEETAKVMVDEGVDIVIVQLDAWSDELYSAIQNPQDPTAANLNRVLASADLLANASRAQNEVRPLVIPEMIKAKPNIHELDSFFDGWTHRTGAACITGFSHRAGQIEDLSVISMAPPARRACRRLLNRTVVLADGSVTACDQDIHGKQPLGRIGDETLSQIWAGAAYQQMRQAHADLSLNTYALCKSCEEWDRP